MVSPLNSGRVVRPQSHSILTVSFICSNMFWNTPFRRVANMPPPTKNTLIRLHVPCSIRCQLRLHARSANFAPAAFLPKIKQMLEVPRREYGDIVNLLVRHTAPVAQRGCTPLPPIRLSLLFARADKFADTRSVSALPSRQA